LTDYLAVGVDSRFFVHAFDGHFGALVAFSHRSGSGMAPKNADQKPATWKFMPKIFAITAAHQNEKEQV
jgi:hypothetical protein